MSETIKTEVSVEGQQNNVVDTEKLAEIIKTEREKIEAETEKKLKETIRATKEQIRGELERVKEESKRKEDELEKARKELDLLKQKTNSSKEEIEKARMESEEKEKLLQIAEERAKKLVENVTNHFNEVLSKKDLEIYKKSKIADYAGEIIPELVTGGSVEEIDQAVEKARAKYKEIEMKALKKKEEEVLMNSKIPTVSSTISNYEDIDYKSLLSMSDKDFDAYSKKLIEEYIKKTK